ncbi:hypothetical protein [Mesorhizobium sp. SP-1A]|uniref:hypothetical protein n=1 Tax=Mesorhizobium sp. SP-1A TaxID=3077840 RepID=UPI0028F719A2|nr:hypothetical protein [Mesorhizobium sp. SP-1A]
MKKFIIASVSALALLSVAACSDSGDDKTTTQSTTPAPADQTTQPATPQANPPANTDNGGGNTMQPAQPKPTTTP